MHPTFAAHIESLVPALERLLSAKAFRFSELARQDVPTAGVYLFSEESDHLYVGRSNAVRKRLQNHCRPGTGERQAAFAFLLARAETGMLVPSYRRDGSRKQLMEIPDFRQSFDRQKSRLAAMSIRIVEEPGPYRQALLEMYAAVALETRFNSFNNH